jgi:hypothetical protein
MFNVVQLQANHCPSWANVPLQSSQIRGGVLAMIPRVYSPVSRVYTTANSFDIPKNGWGTWLRDLFVRTTVHMPVVGGNIRPTCLLLALIEACITPTECMKPLAWSWIELDESTRHAQAFSAPRRPRGQMACGKRGV